MAAGADQVGRAGALALAMTWEIGWALILGFALSAAVQAVVTKGEMSRLLPDDRPRTIALASLLGAASSSCSYAAVALARSLFQKGANFTASIAFEFASTNLVVELGVILALLMGWQFTLAEFVGGPIMIAILVVLFRIFLRPRLLDAARAQAERGLRGSMEGHALMDMSVGGEGNVVQRAFSGRGFTAISHYFVMDWAAVWKDIAGGLVLAAALGTFVPSSFWHGFFLTDQPVLAALWGPLVGPLVSVVSFVCSIGNVPLAAVLWNSGISFGGVISFIFADLIVLPVLNIYRTYYGLRMTAFLAATSYAAIVLAGYAVELLFGALHLIPAQRIAIVADPQITLNYTSVLNVVFLAIAAVLLVRAHRTGVRGMLATMDGSPAPTGPASIVPATDAQDRYTCPMHSDVVQSAPGQCPRCGMTLELPAREASREPLA
ncbi:MAG TPA: permease [Candidatus Limnocylindrales bacterium]